MSVLDTIASNKEWLFSGAGLALLGILARLLWARLTRKDSAHHVSATVHMTVAGAQVQPPSDTPTFAAEISKVSGFSLNQISSAIRAAPPLQRADVANRYCGLLVQWETLLWNASMMDEEHVSLTLDFGSNDTNIVTCKVKLSDYRELGVLEKGAKITVFGRIAKASLGSAELEDVRLYFHSV